MAVANGKTGKLSLLRPGSGRYILLSLFWILWGGLVVMGLPRVTSNPLEIKVLGPAVLDKVRVGGWITAIPFRTFPFLDHGHLETLKKAHPWIESISEKRILGSGRVVRVKVWDPVALLRPSYGLLALQSQPPKAHPSRVSYLNNQGLSLLGNAYAGSGTLPQVIVKSPLTKTVGLRLVRTIRTVRHCRSEGAPEGRWFSLNGPHEIRFYPGHNLPILLLGTDLGCSPFKLFQSFMKNAQSLSPGQLPEGVDLRFSGMLLLRPSLDETPNPPSSSPPVRS